MHAMSIQITTMHVALPEIMATIDILFRRLVDNVVAAQHQR